MGTLRGEVRRVVQTLEVPDGMNSLSADIGSDWRDRAVKLQESLRLLRWMTATALVLAATVLFRVFTH